MDNTHIYYIYNEEGEHIGCVRATDILEAYKEAESATGIPSDNLSVERS